MDRLDIHSAPGPVLRAARRAIVAHWTEGRSLDEATADAAEAAYARSVALGCDELRATVARHLVEDVGAEMRREIDELTSVPPA